MNIKKSSFDCLHFVNIFFFTALLHKHLEAYHAGMLTGDMEYATLSLYMYASSALWSCGDDLSELEKRIRIYIRRSIQCKQGLITNCLLIIHQHVLDLIGSNEDSYVTFLNCTEEDFFLNARANNKDSFCRSICNKQKYVSFITGEMESAAKWLEKSMDYPVGMNPTFVSIIVGTFIDGLIALFFARKHGEDEERWTKLGEGVINSMKQWSRTSDWNFSNKLYLLEAEYYFLKDNEAMALEKYEASILAARYHLFIHEEGLAFEKVANYHLHRGNNTEALYNFAQAKRCYERWGAQTLVDHIRRTMLVFVSV